MHAVNDVLNLLGQVYHRTHVGRRTREFNRKKPTEARLNHVVELALEWAVIQGIKVEWPLTYVMVEEPDAEFDFEPRAPEDDPMDLADLGVEEEEEVVFEPLFIAAQPDLVEYDLALYDNAF